MLGPNNEPVHFRAFDINNELSQSSLFQYFIPKSHKMAILLQFLVKSRWFYDRLPKFGVILAIFEPILTDLWLLSW